MLDLDHFKRLNDAHGHAAGDAVLRAVAASLSATVRPTDVLARTGGEELVVLGLVGDPDEAARLAERLRAAVASTRTADGHAVTASIGVALTRPGDGEDATDAAVAADRPGRRRDVRGQAAGPGPGGVDVGAARPDARARGERRPTGDVA